jgi:hypothetical protein
VPVITGCEGGDLNPYASYGASTSSRQTSPSGIQGTENTTSQSGSPPLDTSQTHVANALANALAEVDRLRAELAALQPGPALKIVKG